MQKEIQDLFLAHAKIFISEEISLQESLSLERARVQHNAKLASLGEMSAGIAHEINNPLSVISGNLLQLKKLKDDPKKFNSKLETMIKSTNRIDKIVKGLRKFARTSESNAYSIESIQNIINETLVLTEAKIKRHSTTITTEIEAELYIYCDAVEIEQVLVNLINNSVDAVKTAPSSWIKIIAFSKDSEVIVQVIDSGPTIAPEIEQKLFQPFFTTKVIGEGTGLGLSIAKGILDSHKASITINRSFPTTCFEIRFPASINPKIKLTA